MRGDYMITSILGSVEGKKGISDTFPPPLQTHRTSARDKEK